MVKRSAVLKAVEKILNDHHSNVEYTADKAANEILTLLEKIMEPKARPLTNKELEEHPLVKQVHDSRKDEIRNYVMGLEYEYKNEWVPEDE